MGQKISEHPAVDYWVKLMREGDPKGARYPVRETSNRRDLDYFAGMQRLRTRVYSRVELKPGDRPGVPPSRKRCVRCGQKIGLRSPTKRVVKQVWNRDGSRLDYFICGQC